MKKTTTAMKALAGFFGLTLALSVASAQAGASGSEVTAMNTSSVSSLALSSGKAPVPASPADLNHDGFVDGIDVDLFWNAYESGARLADLNGDRYVDGIDHDIFMNALAAAQPFNPADLNHDGYVDGMDIDLFWNAVAAGSLDVDLNSDGYFDGIDMDIFLTALEVQSMEEQGIEL